jgi:hypothetical protein
LISGNFHAFIFFILITAIVGHFSKNATIHDEFFTKNNFPTPRIKDQFIGQSFDENDNTSEEHIHALYIS